MGDLTNKQISATYDGLIKTSDEQPIDGNLKTLQDGVGNNLPMEVSTTGVNFTGTVTGIDTGVQSVVAGTNVTVDNTDPANPIVSAAGGGGGNVAFSIPYTQLSGPSSADAIGASVRIPAGSFANGDLLQINGTVIKNNPTGWQYLAMWIGDDNTTLFNGTQIGTDQSPNTGTTLPLLIFKTLAISTNDSRTYGQDENSFFDSVNRTVIVNGDINWAIDQYLNFVYYIDDAAATCTIENITIAKIN